MITQIQFNGYNYHEVLNFFRGQWVSFWLDCGNLISLKLKRGDEVKIERGDIVKKVDGQYKIITKTKW
jgi:hypothetical protein